MDFMTIPNQAATFAPSDNCSIAESLGTADGADEFLHMVHDLCRNEDGKISIKQFFEEIQKSGIRTNTDPRLANMMRRLLNLTPSSLSVKDLKLDTLTFKTVLSENLVLVTKAFQNQFIIQNYEGFCESITEIYEKCKTNEEGKAANYIPQLGLYGPEKWGVSICTVDGQRFSIGDATEPFTVQATSQAITYGICLNELGQRLVHKYEGREHSGRKFNEIALDHQNKPHNPLVNSGAIMSAALILQLVKPELEGMSEKYEYVFDFFKRLAGGEYLGFNNSVYLSERDHSFRNFSLAYFMSENKCFPEGVDIKKTIDLYSQICSLEMTCESNSVIAGTLANGGVCPLTGERVMNPEAVQNLLSLMYSCGLYNYSGQFAFDVGLPAKSGVSGALMIIVPNVMGITLWSPNLDTFGNSVRGIQFCRELVKLYSFHRFERVGHQPDLKSNILSRKRDVSTEAVVQILMAASCGDIVELQRAWLRDIDLNIADYDGRTPLHLAASEGYYECVHFLIYTVQVHPNPRDRWKHTPLDEALMFNHEEVAQLIRHYMDEHPDDFASRENDFDDEEIAAFVDIREEEHSESDTPMFSRQTSISESLDSYPAYSKRLSLPKIMVEDVLNHDHDPAADNPPDVVTSMARKTRSQSLTVLLPRKINTRSPRPTPRGSPTLPRARFRPIQ